MELLTALTTLTLFVISMLAGALNAVAGGGSFLTLPALIYSGVPPVMANATSTVALWPGSVSSAWAYRRELSDSRQWLVILGFVSLFGGLIGALLLIRTSNAAFLRLLPWLMLAAAATFTFGSRLTACLGDRGQQLLRTVHGGPTIWTLILQLTIAIYGGYFGGGMGIMMLAIFAVTGMTDMHAMNGLKAFLAVAINGVAVLEFSRTGSVAWAPAVVMIAGGVAGGYTGAALARQLRGQAVRRIVILTAWAMTGYFFLRGA